MWQELPPDSRANKKFANAIYDFKKPYVGGYEHFSAAASSSQKGVRMMSSLNQRYNAAGRQAGRRRWRAGGGAAADPPLSRASALPLPGRNLGQPEDPLRAGWALNSSPCLLSLPAAKAWKSAA